MCTAITFKSGDHYFGRNLDLEFSYGESVVITPQNFPFHFRQEKPLLHHYGIIGIGIISDNFPLYYDATNEEGLSIAGLNFPDNAFYCRPASGKNNIAPYELIPWILGKCRTTLEAKSLLETLTVVNIPFNDQISLSPLHWIIADANSAITVEPTKDGLKIYNNNIGVLTNNPPFDFHLQNINNYIGLTPNEPINRFSTQLNLTPYSRGMGALGLPGDVSSASRFIRAAFNKLNAACTMAETESITQFFHIMESVSQTEGCVKTELGLEKTVYTSCCNTNKGIYYYTTYGNRQISAVDIRRYDLTETQLKSYPLINTQQIFNIN